MHLSHPFQLIMIHHVQSGATSDCTSAQGVDAEPCGLHVNRKLPRAGTPQLSDGKHSERQSPGETRARPRISLTASTDEVPVTIRPTALGSRPPHVLASRVLPVEGGVGNFLPLSTGWWLTRMKLASIVVKAQHRTALSFPTEQRVPTPYHPFLVRVPGGDRTTIIDAVTRVEAALLAAGRVIPTGAGLVVP